MRLYVTDIDVKLDIMQLLLLSWFLHLHHLYHHHLIIISSKKMLTAAIMPINVVCWKQALCLEFMVRTEEGQASWVGQGVTGAKGAEEGPASRSRLGSGNAGQGYAFEEVKVLFLILMDLCRRTSGLAHPLPVSQVGSNNIQVRLHYTILPEVVEASLGPHMQDLAVVVLLILIPLISPNSSKGGVGFHAISEALGLASLKAVIAISAIIAGGRLLLRPIYKQIAENQNAEIFSTNTLLYKEETTDAAMAAIDAAEKSLSFIQYAQNFNELSKFLAPRMYIGHGIIVLVEVQIVHAAGWK
ncbi:hypothetical protein POM88_015990 [Heracleum sosnowskyi]|uniref:Uncharacterized protein n=1 Tax=Heracleum sosnowskyi TaxID=360622 RepID=A0AAD8MWX8_9APIA|nr:hypothetical protein POM88_015990 [Heracleum sosnowskyi]